MNITCAIVDDEPLAISLLENFVRRTPFLELKASYNDSVQAITELKAHPVNLLFLDIQMPDLDGMELSRMVPSETRIIFTTAFKEYAFDSYEVNALDFLLKPIRYNKFLASVEKAKNWFEMLSSQKQDLRESIYLRVDGELKRVDIANIIYVCGMKDYVMFYLKNEKRPLVTHLTMKAVEEMLPSNDFMRVHRSYIISLNKIRSVDRNNCIYIGDEVIHVTDAYKELFDQYLKKNLPNS
ncbi:MAG: LytR/AlgR family response regulator transcription factor [Phocaeicola sp.]|uniref:LytR/AlgR family response regulator transcription factor n=1 Tax=Phocaeicola TaxID=909656 RepID=UPI00234EC811|nr:LytTR family DNA-binding domain-containing protein [Phocaeicola oris]MCE2616604.1 LytTR family DNA-binding domain-containing protein [Phocaeicola oris]